ncbi:MAG TPA: hypothetical protein VI457_01480 [Methylococcaceae bacterium]|nr:hypothetical protein [Methylococcaceae bacterium]
MSDPLAEAENTARQRVVAYLTRLGVKDDELVQGITDYCLYRARRRVAHSGHEELPRRAIEEAMRKVDKAIAHAFGAGYADPRNLARIRVALELGSVAFPLETVLRGSEISPDSREALLSVLPQATPPEAPQPLAEQRFEFFLG